MAQTFYLTLVLEQDGIEIRLSNDNVEFKQASTDAVIRPRHIGLANEILRVIREKGK